MKNEIFGALLCIVAGYLIGTINPAYYIAKLRGFDIRQKGSGNAGASNAAITMGKLVGLFIALFDIAKAFFAVRLAQHFFPGVRYAAELAGIFSAIGHIFPFTMGFRGGKGTACLGGIILAFSWKVFLVMLSVELALAFLLDYICVVPITASAAFPIVYYFLTWRTLGALLYALLAPLYLYKHRDNLQRIREGKEARFSYLWSKDEKVLAMAREIRGK